ncbi:MAG: hypothetical protein JW934_22160 [Anaerolineae bacterium]|nr:hypothetical protein [Anaerolineae bacterium]
MAALRKRLSTSAVQLWLALLAFLSIGMLPCPECGTPMILHIWPLAGIVAMVQALRRHYQRRQTAQRQDGQADQVDS